MITNTLIIKGLILSAAALFALLILARLYTPLLTVWLRATKFGRSAFFFIAITLCLFAGTKHPTNDTGHAGAPRMMMPRRAAAAPRPSPFSAPAGYELIASFIDPTYDFATSRPATTNTKWTAHGAYEAWCPIPGYTAFTGGYLRLSPRNDGSEFGYHDSDYLGAVPGLSTLWWGQSNETFIATWQNFARGPDTNNLISIQIQINPLEYVIRANEDVRVYGKTYNPTNDTSLLLLLDAPQGVIKNGCARPVTAHLQSIQTVLGTVRLNCTAGSKHVAFYQDADCTMPLPLPLEFDAHEFSSFTFYALWASTSQNVDDIELTLTLTGTTENAAETRTAHLTAAEITNLNLVSSYAQDTDELAPPFNVGTVAQFDVEKSKGSADRHLCIPYSPVLLPDTSTVRDFSVHATLGLAPEGYDEPVSWQMLSGTPSSGSIVPTGTNTADLRNPKVGGVYRLAAALGGIETQGVVVLPLAGASVDDDIESDIASADMFCALASIHFPKIELRRISFGYYFFCLHSKGYYRGRPNNAQNPTVWAYNAVNDDTGLGAICTLGGRPLYLEKLSNFLAGYVCKKLGVTPLEAWVAQLYGTWNNAGATASWDAGEELAQPDHASLETILSEMAEEVWTSETAEKARALWPNLSPADNHRTGRVNFNYYYSSPGMLDTSEQEFEIPEELTDQLLDQIWRTFRDDHPYIGYAISFITQIGD